jgi:hypothetical protein
MKSEGDMDKRDIVELFNHLCRIKAHLFNLGIAHAWWMLSLVGFTMHYWYSASAALAFGLYMAFTNQSVNKS